ncbi:YdgA family protein [Sulfurovum sp. bin170]|uniref:YdgA family protein n=1 Tax=Sulfurovum sp. bin170 TaxID=2695268 RepID=UPI0013DEE919|nr:YdgA family protein [Sulfurovum sp. bin170]NEW61494.1 YdgA family protein [Sulfurovum sp. bin170]
MKKIGLALIALVVIIGIYYTTLGSTQIVDEMKKEVNRELTEAKKSGFVIEDREIKENRERFIIDFNDTKKITNYLKEESRGISESDIELLKGLKVAVEIEYMPTTKDAIALDIYPVTLPEFIYLGLKGEDKKIEEVNKMVKDRLLLVHVNINKLLSGFDGYMKDIDMSDDDGNFKMKGFVFDGEIEDENIKNLNQKIQEMSYEVPSQLKMGLSNLKVFVSNPIDRNYNNNSNYTLESLKIKSENNESFSLAINNISGSSQDTQKGKLANGIADLNIVSIDYDANGDKTLLNNIKLDMKMNNIDMDAILELEEMLSNSAENNFSIEQMIPLIKKIVSDDISLDIPNISLDKITQNGKTFDGFKLQISTKVDKKFDWKLAESDPLAMTNIFDAKMNIEASNELVDIISSNPQAMMMMMVMQPVEKSGKKHYDIEFTKGSLKINGKPFM